MNITEDKDCKEDWMSTQKLLLLWLRVHRRRHKTGSHAKGKIASGRNKQKLLADCSTTVIWPLIESVYPSTFSSPAYREVQSAFIE